MNKSSFDIPVVLFTFKRSNTVERILKVLKQVNVSKLYLFSDGGRDEDEQELVNKARIDIMQMIDWKCEVIKMFAESNQGVFNQIAMGAKRVFEKESKAIFLEDDNLPEPSFFSYSTLISLIAYPWLIAIYISLINLFDFGVHLLIILPPFQ